MENQHEIPRNCFRTTSTIIKQHQQTSNQRQLLQKTLNIIRQHHQLQKSLNNIKQHR